MKNWYVTYKVKGFDKDFEAGPYFFTELESQVNDIAGFDGIYDVRVLQKEEKQNDNPVL